MAISYYGCCLLSSHHSVFGEFHKGITWSLLVFLLEKVLEHVIWESAEVWCVRLSAWYLCFSGLVYKGSLYLHMHISISVSTFSQRSHKKNLSTVDELCSPGEVFNACITELHIFSQDNFSKWNFSLDSSLLCQLTLTSSCFNVSNMYLGPPSFLTHVREG